MKKEYLYLIFSALFFCSLAFVSSCARDYIKLSPQEIDELNASYAGKKFYLASSCYYGYFWSDDSHYYISPYTPASLTYLSSPLGENIPPPHYIDVIPAGSSLLVRSFEFPKAAVVSSRPLQTPRYYPWLITDLSLGDKTIPVILVIPTGVSEPPRAIKQKVDALLASEDLTAKLESFTKEEREAIRHKIPFVGMSKEAALMTLGPPQELTGDYHGKSSEEFWKYYDGKSYQIENDKLVEILTSK